MACAQKPQVHLFLFLSRDGYRLQLFLFPGLSIPLITSFMDCLHLPCPLEGPATRATACVLGIPGSVVLYKRKRSLFVSCACSLCICLTFICAFGYECILDWSSKKHL